MRLIDADEVLRLFGEEYEETKELIHNGETHLDSLAEGFTEAYHIIKYVLPTVDAVPVVHGRWIMRGGKFRCSVCDAKANWVECGGSCFSHEYEQVKSPWCHSCGAKMDGGAE